MIYCIILKNWYQEFPSDGYQYEIFHNKSFECIEDAMDYLIKNSAEIIAFYPIEELKIKLLTEEEFKNFYK